MKFFLDSANLKEIRDAHECGLLDGITTNPTLLSKEGNDPVEQLKEICTIVNGSISAEVVASDTDGMVKEGRDLAKIHDNITVKIPMTKAGMKAVRQLTSDGIKVNVTLVFHATQALVAAKAGATYVSPFVGRLDDVTTYGMDSIEKIVQIFDNYGYQTEIIVASIRHPLHVLEGALYGAHIATMPHKIFEQLFKHPLTDIGIDRFLADWKKLTGS